MRYWLITLFILFLFFPLKGQESRIKLRALTDFEANLCKDPLKATLDGKRIIPRKISMYVFGETEIDSKTYVIVKIANERGLMKISEDSRVEIHNYYLVEKKYLLNSTIPTNKKLQISPTGERYYWEALTDFHVNDCDFNKANDSESRQGKRDWLPEGTGFVTVGKQTQAKPEDTAKDVLDNVHIIKIVNYRHERNLDVAQREILYTKFAKFSIEKPGNARSDDSLKGVNQYYYIKDDILEYPYSRKVYEVWGNSTQLSLSALTIPIKMRLGNKRDQNDDPDDDADDLDFDFSTDFSVGPFAGVRMRINRTRPWYITAGGSFALTFVSINSDSISNRNQKTSPVNIAAVTMALAPIIVEFDKFQIGTALGIDIVGKDNQDWVYNKKLWFSVAMGYSFLKPKEERIKQ